MKSFFIWILIFFSASLSFSQRPNSQQFVILGITVEGNKSAESVTIIGNSGLNVGDTITLPGGEAIRTAISNLWATKLFSDIKIIQDNIVGNGIYLLIKVIENSRFDRLDITGNDELDQDDIQKKISFSKGEIISPQNIAKAIKKLKNEYEDKGYLYADIQYNLEKIDSSKGCVAILKLKIDEGKEVHIEHIEFEGNTAFSSDDLKSEFSDTHEKVWWKFWRSSKFDKKKFVEDKQKLINFYHKNGYKDFQLLSDTLVFLPESKSLEIIFKIDEGPQYKVRNITWDGNTIYSAEILNERLAFKKGDLYDQEKFDQNLRSNQDQSDVASLYLDNGYLTFNAEPEEVRVGDDSIDIVIHVIERNQFKNGDITITGNTKTQDNVIRRELFTLPGEYFNRGDIIRSIRQLSQLNYFNPEKIKPDYKLQDDKTVNLAYDVEEKSSDQVNASVGYSQAFGATGALGFTINNFSLRDPLVGGAGQILNFEWQFGRGSRFQTFTLNFTEPWLYDTPTSVGFSLFDTRQNYVYDLRQTGVSWHVGRRLRWPDNYSRGDWTVRYQHNDVREGAYYYDKGRTNQYTCSQVLSRNSTDSPIFPTQGSNVSFSIDISGGPVLPGNVDFYKYELNAEKYTPLFSTNKVVLYSSISTGVANGFYAHSFVPINEKFFMGGTGLGYISTTPLRGYDDQSIGPRTPSGRPEGGKIFLKNSIELRYSLALNPIPIYILSFAEAGNVWRNGSQVDIFNLKRSAGFGVRLLIMPIGMIGFDYGFGFDDVYPFDGKRDGWKFHFVFGRGF